MLVCPVCGFRNPDANDRCVRCSAILKRNMALIDEAFSEGTEKARAVKLHLLWQGPLEHLQRIAARVSGPLPQGIPYRYPLTAGLLSIIPGGGQLYNRQYHKAAIFFLSGFFLLGICLLTLRESYSNILLLCSLVIWVLIWNDAVSSAVRINGQYWSLRNSLALLFAGLFLIGITVTGAQFFGLSAVTLVRVRQDIHRPVIRTGDRILVNHLSYLFSEPRRGETVYFDPPRFTAEDRTANTYSINIKSYFQKVLGVPGDHLVKRGTEITRNGIIVPFSDYPFGADVLPDFDVRVPSGRYFVPISYIPQDLIAGALVSVFQGSAVTHAFQSGFVFQGWENACLPSEKEIFGRAAAIVDPPQHRDWL